MNLKNKDPFGGVHGESESSAPSPFKIDKDEAIKKSCEKEFFTDSQRRKKKKRKY